MLKDLDQVEWRNDHVPALLRAMADGARDITPGLYEHLSDQGTIRPDAVPAVPFLLELARDAPHGRAGIADVVAYLAGAGDDATWDAVVAHIDEVVALTADDDGNVRTAAYLTLSHCRVTYPAAVLRRRWTLETDPTARLALLLALGARDPERSVRLLAGTVLGDVPDERIAAALALHRARLPLPPDAAPAVADAFAAGADLGRPLGMLPDEAVREVVAHSPDLGFVDGFLSSTVRPGSARLTDGIWALAGRLEVSRSAPGRYLPLLRPLLDAQAALSIADQGGLGVAILGDELAAIAERLHDRDGREQTTAAHALLRLGDPRWVAPACALWSRGEATLHGGTYGPVGNDLVAVLAQHLTLATLRADVGIVTGLASYVALQARLAGINRVTVGATGTPGPGIPRGGMPGDGMPGDGVGKRLAGLAPALRAAVDIAPVPVLRALLAVGAATDEEVYALAGHADEDAAVAWCHRTGDGRFLATWLAAHLDGRYLARNLRAVLPATGLSSATELSAVTGLSSGAAGPTHAATGLSAVVPVVRPLLDHADPDVQFAAAQVLHATGEPEPVRARIAGVLAAGWTAARHAAELADASHEPLLRALLDSSVACLAAARALARLGVPREELTGGVVLGVEALASWVDVATITAACRDLAGDRARATLLDLAERDARITDGGNLATVIWRDELWRDTVRAALT